MLMLWGEGDNQILKRLAIVSLFIVSPCFPPLLWHSSQTQYIVYVAPRAPFVFFRYSSNRGFIYLFWLCWGLPGCSGRGSSLGAHALLPWWRLSLGSRASRCSGSAAAVPRLQVRAPQLRPLGSAAPQAWAVFPDLIRDRTHVSCTGRRVLLLEPPGKLLFFPILRLDHLNWSMSSLLIYSPAVSNLLLSYCDF